MFTNKRFTIFTISIIAVAGVALLLTAIFYAPQPKLYAWYWQDGKVYRYDVETRTREIINLPAKGEIKRASLSQDAQQIAYTDDEGLKVASTKYLSTKLLAKTEIGTVSSGATYPIYFLPYDWSPDGKWFFTKHMVWEDSLLSVVSAVDGKTYPVKLNGRETGCLSEPSWSPDSKAFSTSRWSMVGLGCDDVGGVFVAYTSVLELKRIYFEMFSYTGEPAEGGTSSAVWSPRGDWIAFAQTSRYGPKVILKDQEPISETMEKLMLSRSDGLQTLTLASVDLARINSIKWSSDGKRLFYSVLPEGKRQTEIYTITIDTLIKTKIHTNSDSTLVSVAPNGNWVLLNTTEEVSNKTIIKLSIFNTTTTDEIVIAEVIRVNEWQIGFAGWELVK